jgi:predicted MPP superfamily phosphohydrolase
VIARRGLTRTLTFALAAAAAAAVYATNSATAEAPAVAPEFKFLEVNDIHILDEKSQAYPLAVVAAMNREKAALVLVCGDVATDGKEDELRRAKSVLDRLEAPYRIAIGNHDALFRGERAETSFKAVFGLRETTYVFTSHGITFVAVDPGAGTDFQRNQVRPLVMDRHGEIAGRLPAGAPVILFSHYPYGKPVRYRTRNADAVMAVFGKQRLLAVVGAHFHGNTESRENGVLHTTTATASSTRPNHDGTAPKGYRVFWVRGGREIRTEFREVAP